MKRYHLAALLLLLAACTPKVAEWTPAESPKENKVERIVFTHFIYYPEKTKAMEDNEKKRLLLFLKRNVLRPSAVTAILIEYGGHSKKRIKDIQRELIKFGIPYDLIVDDSETGIPCQNAQLKHPKAKEGGVEVIIERYIVIPPECADFSQSMGDARQEYTNSNFGCADAVNMGMMVANPRDLLLGRTLGDSDGQVIAAGVKRYRDDKVKKLIDVSTNVDPGSLFGQSGSGSGTSTSTSSSTSSY